MPVYKKGFCVALFIGESPGVITYHPAPRCTAWHASVQRNHPVDEDRGNTGRVLVRISKCGMFCYGRRFEHRYVRVLPGCDAATVFQG